MHNQKSISLNDNSEKRNKIIMIYRIPSEEERPEAINILGNEFVDNKKDKCVLIVNRQEREVSFFIEIKDFKNGRLFKNR